MTAVVEEFTQIFREEHRQVRDDLLALVDAFQERDRARAGTLLERIAAATGPHFRYEEESLYPALVAIFGEEYIQKLLADHDQAIANAAGLVELAQQESLSDADVEEAVRLTRAILPHVSDCDGLSIMVEVVPEDTVHHVLATRDRARTADLDLLTWSRTVRERPALQ